MKKNWHCIVTTLIVISVSVFFVSSSTLAFQKPEHQLAQPKGLSQALSRSGQPVKTKNLRHSGNEARLVKDKSLAAGVAGTSVLTINLESGNSIKELKRRQDDQGHTYTRYRQYAHGIPVWGEHIIIVSKQKEVKIRGNYLSGIQPELAQVQPTISASQAVSQAQAEHRTLIAGLHNFVYSDEQVELVYYRDENDHLYLAYMVTFFGEIPGEGHPTQPYFVIDAQSNQTITYWDGLMHDMVGTGPGGNLKTGQYEYGTDFSHMDVTVVGDVCTMESSHVKTVNLNHNTYGTTAYSYSPPYRNTHKEINGAYSPLNDAHYFGNVVYNLYTQWYGTQPLPFQLVLRVHYSSNYENAFWRPSDKTMNFGDGHTMFHPLVSLDVTSHEIAHAVTDEHSDLIYSGQSGGINEAFSDMAGEAAEYFLHSSNDFLVGKDIFKAANQALRYMADPPLDGYSIDHVNDYYSGMDVHFSSGIYNKAFYLLANTAGWDTRKAFEVFFKANQDYWTPSTNFIEGAFGVLDAVADLGYNTSDVKNAFLQVGINTTTPIITVNQPDGSYDSATSSFKIEWTDYEPDYNASISLYYDTDNNGQNGTLIVSNLSEDNDPDYYLWNTSGLIAGNYYVYAFIDNGVDPPVVDYSSGPVTIVAPDAYEPDDTASQASTIGINETQYNHSILPVGDTDYVKFQIVNVPNPIVLETSGLSGDTVMWLYTADGTTQLAYDDQGGSGNWSKINYTITSPGIYNVKVEDYLNNSTINNYNLTLSGTPPHALDLIVESISNSPAQPEAGDPMTFWVTVRNSGITDDASGFTVGFWSHLASAPLITTTPEQEQVLAGLAKGISTVLAFPVIAPSSGNFKAWAYVDRKNGISEVTEQDETNNAGPLAGHNWQIISVATLPFSEGFETGSLQSHWTTKSTNAGRIQISSNYSPQTGNYHALLDATTNGNYSLNEMILHVDLNGRNNVVLQFFHKHFNDEYDYMPLTFTGSSNSDGVAMSIDGTQWYRVQGLTNGSTSYQQYTLTLDTIAAANGLDFNDHVFLKFQQYDNFSITTDGFAFDNISITGDHINTPTITVTSTITPTNTISATITNTPTITQTSTITPTLTHSATYTITPTITITSTITPTLTHSATYTITPTVTATPSITPTLSHSATHTPTPTVTMTGTHTPTSTVTPTRTSTATTTATPSWTITTTAIPTLTRTATIIPTITFNNKQVIVYPNPSRDVVNFTWKQEHVNEVKISIFTMSGELVSQVHQRYPGDQIAWNANNVGPGIYLCRIVLYVEGNVTVQKIKKIAILK